MYYINNKKIRKVLVVMMLSYIQQREMLTVKNGCREFCKTRFSVSVCATSS